MEDHDLDDVTLQREAGRDADDGANDTHQRRLGHDRDEDLSPRGPDGTEQWWVRSSKGTWIALRHRRVVVNADGSITLLFLA